MPPDQNLVQPINDYLVSFTWNFKHYSNNGVKIVIKHVWRSINRVPRTKSSSPNKVVRQVLVRDRRTGPNLHPSPKSRPRFGVYLCPSTCPRPCPRLEFLSPKLGLSEVKLVRIRVRIQAHVQTRVQSPGFFRDLIRRSLALKTIKWLKWTRVHRLDKKVSFKNDSSSHMIKNSCLTGRIEPAPYWNPTRTKCHFVHFQPFSILYPFMFTYVCKLICKLLKKSIT